MSEALKKQEKTEMTKSQHPVFAPDVDIRETAEAFEILADIPGVDQKSLDIDLERNKLTIHGSQLNEGKADGMEAVYQEYRTGDYERSFTLGAMIDRDNVHATVSNGVLRLLLPKAKEAKPLKIKVKAE